MMTIPIDRAILELLTFNDRQSLLPESFNKRSTLFRLRCWFQYFFSRLISFTNRGFSLWSLVEPVITVGIKPNERVSSHRELERT